MGSNTNDCHIPLSTEIENRAGAELADAICEAFTRSAEQTERQLLLAWHRSTWRKMVLAESLPVLLATPPEELPRRARTVLRIMRWRMFGLESPETRREERMSFVFAVLRTWHRLQSCGGATISEAILFLLRSEPNLRPHRNEPYNEQTEPRFLKEALKRFERGVQDYLCTLGETPAEQRRTAETLMLQIVRLSEHHPNPNVMHNGAWFDAVTLSYLLAFRL